MYGKSAVFLFQHQSPELRAYASCSNRVLSSYGADMGISLMLSYYSIYHASAGKTNVYKKGKVEVF